MATPPSLHQIPEPGQDAAAAVLSKCKDKLEQELGSDWEWPPPDGMLDGLDMPAESEGEWQALDELFSAPGRKRVHSVAVERFESWAEQNGFKEEDVVRMVDELQRQDAFGGAEEAPERRIHLQQICHLRRKGVATLTKALRQRRGTVLRAWRLDLDLRGTGRVDYSDIERSCAAIGHGLDFQLVRCALRLHGPGPPSLRHLEHSEASNFGLFARAVGAPELDVDDAWERLDPSGQGAVTLEQFVRGAGELGFRGDAELLFHGLDTSGQGRLSREDFAYIAALADGMARSLTVPSPPVRAWAEEAAPCAPVMAALHFEDAEEGADSEAAAHFVRWALPRWHLLRKLFCLEDKRYRSVPVAAFVRWIQQLQFDGDTFAVLRQLQREGPPSGRGAAVEELPHAGSAELSLPQLQRLRQRHGRAAAGALLAALRRRRGTVLRTFRLDLDLQGKGCAARADFERTCHVLGCGIDAEAIWDVLRPSGGSDPLEFGELEPAEASNVQRFAQAMLAEVGFDLNRAWSRLDPHDRGAATLEHFASVAASLQGPTCDADLLAKGLDISGQGLLGRDELEYAWLLVLRAMRAWARRRAQRKSEAPPERAGEGGCASGDLQDPASLQEPGSTPRQSQDWASELGELLLSRLGLSRSAAGRGIGSKIAARLETLGFSGDIHRLAMDLVQTLLHEAPVPRSAPVPLEKRAEWNDSAVIERKRKPNPRSGSSTKPRTLEENHGSRTELVGSIFRGPPGAYRTGQADRYMGRPPNFRATAARRSSTMHEYMTAPPHAGELSPAKPARRAPDPVSAYLRYSTPGIWSV